MSNYTESKNFYSKCKDEGIVDLQTKANNARMVLLAENEGIIGTEQELVKKFNEGKVFFDREQKEKEERKNRERIDEIRKQQNVQIETVKSYINCIGRDKPIATCKKEISKLQREIDLYEDQLKQLKNSGESLYRSGKLKEKDWAILGGAVSGIAGGAAGLATAIDVQVKNAGIRQQNQQLLGSIAQITANAIIRTGELTRPLKEKIEALKQEIEIYKKRLTEDIFEVDLLLKINPKLLKIERTETGVSELTIQVQPISNLKIYDNVSAVVDGTFKALLIDEDRVVGEACFALPYRGITKSETLIGFCVNSSVSIDKCDVVFVPINLWAIESHDIIKSQNAVAISDKDRNKMIYYFAQDIVRGSSFNVEMYKKAISVMKESSNSEKSTTLIAEWNKAIENIKIREEENRKKKEEKDAQEKARIAEQAERERAEKQKHLKKNIIIASMVVIAIFTIAVVNKVVVPSFKYSKANTIMENGDFENAIIAFEKLDGFKDSEEKIKESKFRRALNLIDTKDYKEALLQLNEISDYKKSSSILDSVYDGILKNASVGDKVYLGYRNYAIDSVDTKERIEWRVLERDDNTMLLITEQIIENRGYDENEIGYATWENSTIRKWLNDEFFQIAFSDDERTVIDTVLLPVAKNPVCEWEHGNETNDRVFLLSTDEVEKYFVSSSSKKATDGNQNFAEWILRTPGKNKYAVACVTSEGELNYNGCHVAFNEGIRPAIRLNLKLLQ